MRLSSPSPLILPKTPLFSLEERKELIVQVLHQHHDKDRIHIEGFDGLLVNFARQKKATAIIRGLRAVSDFEYELQMALMNRRLADEISTVFMMPHEKYTYLNSTIVKEVARLGGDISNFVPPVVEKALQQNFFTSKPSLSSPSTPSFIFFL